MKHTIKICAVLLIMIILGACTSKKQEDKTTLRIAFFPNITHAQALVGKAEGLFQKSLGDMNRIEWKMFNAGPSEIEALFAGEVDIGYIGPGPAINGYAKSKGEVRILAGAVDGGAILVSRKDLKIKNIAELKGKKVAVPQFGNTQDLCLRNLLQQNGLKDSTRGGDVEIVQVNNPDTKTLLDRGDIDAALVPEPWGSVLVNDIKANVVLDYDRVFRDGMYPSAVVIVRNDFLKKHPALVRKFIETHVEITDYINSNPEKAKEIINTQIGELTKKTLAKDILDASFKRLKITYDPEKKSVNELVNLMVDTGFLKDKPDTSGLFIMDILNKVLRAKGKKEID